MSSIDYHAGPPPPEKIPFLATVLRAMGWFFLLSAVFAIPLSLARDVAGVNAYVGTAVGGLFFSVVCFSFAKIIVLLTKIEENTNTEGSLAQELKLLREIAKRSESKSKETPPSRT